MVVRGMKCALAVVALVVCPERHPGRTVASPGRIHCAFSTTLCETMEALGVAGVVAVAVAGEVAAKPDRHSAP